jgi:hypothetical protein
MAYTLPRPETTLEVPIETRLARTLAAGVPALDRILGAFRGGEVTLIDSSSTFVYTLQSLLCVRNVQEHGSEVVFLDGGNSVDPHGMVSLGKRVGLARGDLLPMVNVARAFTCYQMASLVLDVARRKVEDTGAGLLVLSCFPELYLDEDVPAIEALELFRQSMRRVREIAEREDLITLVTNAGLTKLQRRKGIRRVLYEGADRRLRFQQAKDAVVITDLDDYRRAVYQPVPAGQTTLEDFEAGAPGLPLDFAAHEVRESEHLFMGW